MKNENFYNSIKRDKEVEIIFKWVQHSFQRLHYDSGFSKRKASMYNVCEYFLDYIQELKANVGSLALTLQYVNMQMNHKSPLLKYTSWTKASFGPALSFSQESANHHAYLIFTVYAINSYREQFLSHIVYRVNYWETNLNILFLQFQRVK